MPNLTIKLVGNDPASGREVVLSSQETAEYDVTSIERAIRRCVEDALQNAAHSNAQGLTRWCPEVAVSLSAPPDENLRPAFHLSREVLELLASIGAEFDFDPYCWTQ